MFLSRTLACAVLCCAAIWAQDGNTDLHFEAASIKRSAPAGGVIQYRGFTGGPGSDDPGRFASKNTSLKLMLMQAYELKPYQVIGPAWMDQDDFDIVAKVSPGTTQEQVRTMLQNLLTERFGLASHRVQREMGVYALVVAKDGSRLQEAGADSGAPGNSGPQKMRIGDDGFQVIRKEAYTPGPMILYRGGRAKLLASGQTVGRIADTLSGQLDRMVVDETGLAGKYEFNLIWTPEAGDPGGRARRSGEEPGEDIFMAVQRQLGLKMVQKKAPIPVLVVERADRVPREN